jgi:uncharacterized protein YggT (Ycf19 family)
MDNNTQKVEETSPQASSPEKRSLKITNKTNSTFSFPEFISRVIWYIDGILLVLLGFRFVFTLIGVNSANSFANFIYKSSHPLVSPFFSLFKYRQNYGVSHFEYSTLVAMAVYVFVAWGLTGLVNLNNRRVQ